MNYDSYSISHAELGVSKIYEHHGIRDPYQLTVEFLSEIFDIKLYFLETTSKLILDGEDVYILLDSRLSETEKLEMFYHELAHYLLEHRPTRMLTLFDHFEIKADNLVQYLAIPYHMLNCIEFESDFLIQEVANQFNISYDLAYKRIENIKKKFVR